MAHQLNDTTPGDMLIRVMVVEDSMTSLELLLNHLSEQDGITVTGVAKNGKEAIDIVENVAPDIILMDINMPIINGYEAAKTIMEEHPVPILLMSATWGLDEVRPILDSMKLGVLGVFEKPPGPGHPQYHELMHKITTALRTMSEVKVIRHWRREKQHESKRDKIPEMRRYERVLIGASTGGPPVLHTILKALPEAYPLPIVIGQHMSSEFIDSFIGWLDEVCAVKVKKAADGEIVQNGHVYIAPEGMHIQLSGRRICLIGAEADAFIVPEISRLYASISAQDAPGTIAILLSGMGRDGAEGITQLHRSGAMTIAQDEASSVVFGMAKEAIASGGIDMVLQPEEIIRILLDAGNPSKHKES